MSWVYNILWLVIFANTVLAVVTVFKEKRDIAATWAWLLVLNLLPVIGFVIYLVVGKKISKERIFDIKLQEKLGINQLVELQKEQWNEKELLPYDLLTRESQQTSRLFLEADQAIFTDNNQVTFYTDGQTKFTQLLTDIANAKDDIHIEYYTFYSDEIGTQILGALEAAQKRGVNVRVIYDSMGSRGQAHHFFKHLEELGGQAEPFFGSKKSYFHSPRLNYRDHRKIVVIDGTIGYIGGFNIGDQYLGRLKKFGNWRDTHLRIIGNAAVALQSQFFQDWNATVKNSPEASPIEYADRYFPLQRAQGSTGIQIVSSGPDNETEAIKLGYLKMISNAHDYIFIQTPYLIPDDSVLEALNVAAFSGVKVKIMIPSMPDHAFVYRATQYYAKELLSKGVEIYQYEDGFMHAKTMVIDGQMASVGSANLDFRSFKLNFEVNAFCYDRKLAVQLTEVFENDEKKSTKLTPEFFEQQSRWLKFKQYFSRLLSPIL
ncbi:cardiolipin synthase [Ligilactobacillus salitolerans]|uniref:Cardiolipin synthase n=1 Tax=Ligilactobacillus salitolerans TaxID=1808352 RepID=A0A401IQZ5_9LACO|nr:cardiolipin synthase [Ligilactobacillus salitolerans]GBG93956.1 cardiolipin synthase [Ligilactobacillus salitolerans]